MGSAVLSRGGEKVTEATVVRDIVKGLRSRLPGAVVFKHADISTAGIPDISISYRNHTTWVEVKLLRRNETRSQTGQHFDHLQLATARLLDRQVETFYLIAFSGQPSGVCATLVRPVQVAAFLEAPTLGYADLMPHSLYHGSLSEVIDALSAFLASS